jgi:hypothetical protein
MRKTNALLLGAAIALTATSAYAREWWFINVHETRCDNAKTSPYTSPQAFTDALIRLGDFQDQQVFRDPTTNDVRSVMVQTKDNTFHYFFTDKSLCEQTLKLGIERGYINKPGELD